MGRPTYEGRNRVIEFDGPKSAVITPAAELRPTKRPGPIAMRSVKAAAGSAPYSKVSSQASEGLERTQVGPNRKCVCVLATGWLLIGGIAAKTVLTKPRLPWSPDSSGRGGGENENENDEEKSQTSGLKNETEWVPPFPESTWGNVVSRHGKLRVIDGVVVSELGAPIQLAGMSLFWSNTGWGGEQYYSRAVVEELVESWGVSLIRAAMGVEDSGGYLDEPTANYERVKTVIDACVELGVYVLVDWHSHEAEKHADDAIDFFSRVAGEYADVPNLIYEIYNEPVDTEWTDVKAYAELVIPALRKNGASENLIVVGTPTYSQDLDLPAADPVLSDDNVAYALHFYAASHSAYIRAKALTAIATGLAVFCTEYGTVRADGDGVPDTAELDAWLDFLGRYHISHANWAVNNKDEGASALLPGVGVADLPWTLPDVLSPSGRIVLQRIQAARLQLFL